MKKQIATNPAYRKVVAALDDCEKRYDALIKRTGVSDDLRLAFLFSRSVTRRTANLKRRGAYREERASPRFRFCYAKSLTNLCPFVETNRIRVTLLVAQKKRGQQLVQCADDEDLYRSVARVSAQGC